MHQLRVAVCRRRANILGQVRGGVPVQQSVAEEQQSVADQQSVAQRSAPEEQESVAQLSVAEEQQSVDKNDNSVAH